MSNDLSDVLGSAIGKAAREVAGNVAASKRKGAGGGLSGPSGIAAGVGLGALAPLAAKGVGKLAKGAARKGAGSMKSAGQKVEGGVKDAVGGGVKDAVGEKLPGGGGKSGGIEGVGKGRRMPIQQSIDVGVPLKTAYNQWTQFEDWPEFMHRLDSVSQEDESHVTFKTKIWGISKEFKAEIVEQRPDKRIKWRVNEGVTHAGVVTFHELAPNLTRIEVSLDVQPGSLIEKAARGMRHVKRAVRADMARFKAYVLMLEDEPGEWRGTIEDGDVKKQRSSSSSSRRSGSGQRSRSSASSNRSSSSRSRSTSRRSGSSSRSRSSNGGSPSGGRGSSRSGRSSSSRGGSSNGSKASSRSSSSRSRSSSNGSSRAKSGSRS